MTRFLKRLRKRVVDKQKRAWREATAVLGHRLPAEWLKGLPTFRYVLVLEAHKDGTPHAHLLIYEAKPGLVTKRDIERCWRPRGHVQAKLARAPRDAVAPAACAAAYLTKYITKLDDRVRASQRLGSTPERGRTLLEHSEACNSSAERLGWRLGADQANDATTTHDDATNVGRLEAVS